MTRLISRFSFLLLSGLLFLAARGVATERPVVVTLHPLLSEMVERMAGEDVRLIELLGPGGDPHTFAPSPGDLARIQEAALVLAMGKNLETYLDRLRSTLPREVPIVEAGRVVPSLHFNGTASEACCLHDGSDHHHHGDLDPHWWQSPVAMRRAAREVSRVLTDLLPAEAEGKIAWQTRALLDEWEALHDWIEGEVTRIPPARRILITAHAAFGYFCAEYGFVALPVRGLSAERDPRPGDLAATIRTIRENGVPAIFPEEGANPAILETLTRETGARRGGRLFADTISRRGMTYEEMMRHNVSTMVAALGEE